MPLLLPAFLPGHGLFAEATGHGLSSRRPSRWGSLFHGQHSVYLLLRWSNRKPLPAGHPARSLSCMLHASEK